MVDQQQRHVDTRSKYTVDINVEGTDPAAVHQQLVSHADDFYREAVRPWELEQREIEERQLREAADAEGSVPEQCNVRSGVTGKQCLMAKGHGEYQPDRYHAFPEPGEDWPTKDVGTNTINEMRQRDLGTAHEEMRPANAARAAAGLKPAVDIHEELAGLLSQVQHVQQGRSLDVAIEAGLSLLSITDETLSGPERTLLARDLADAIGRQLRA